MENIDNMHGEHDVLDSPKTLRSMFLTKTGTSVAVGVNINVIRWGTTITVCFTKSTFQKN